MDGDPPKCKSFHYKFIDDIWNVSMCLVSVLDMADVPFYGLAWSQDQSQHISMEFQIQAPASGATRKKKKKRPPAPSGTVIDFARSKKSTSHYQE